MRKLFILLAVSCLLFTTGCSKEQESEIVKETRTEIDYEMKNYIDYTIKGEYDSVKNMLLKGLTESYAPISFYTSLTTQYPDSKACRSGAMSVAKYIMGRLYTDLNVEQIDVNNDGSEARVLATWKGIDTSKVDVSNMSEIIDKVLNDVYDSNKAEYDNNTALYGEDDTNKKIQEEAFPEIYKKLQNLYEDAPDVDMKGVFCFTYTTGDGWKISGIYEYNELMYEDNKYNWNFEKAQDDFESSKNAINNEG